MACLPLKYNMVVIYWIVVIFLVSTNRDRACRFPRTSVSFRPNLPNLFVKDITHARLRYRFQTSFWFFFASKKKKMIFPDIVPVHLRYIQSLLHQSFCFCFFFFVITPSERVHVVTGRIAGWNCRLVPFRVDAVKPIGQFSSFFFKFLFGVMPIKRTPRKSAEIHNNIFARRFIHSPLKSDEWFPNTIVIIRSLLLHGTRAAYWYFHG